MKTNAENKSETLPEVNEEKEAADFEPDTIPENADSKILIPVKFNKQTHDLTAEQAASLAQKGMKYDIISEDYSRMKSLAGKSGCDVASFLNALEERQESDRKRELLEQCAGNEELTEHILKLENSSNKSFADSFAEISQQIPEIDDISKLPDEVIENARKNSTALLDEYLRYRLRLEREKMDAIDIQKNAQQASVGSQRKATAAENPVTGEFIKALWGN